MIGTDAKPKLILHDATGGIAGPFILADTDQFNAERLPFLYITTGPAMNLPALVLRNGHRLPGPNEWSAADIEKVLHPLQLRSRLVVNYEHFNESPRMYRVMTSRIKSVRPDLQLSTYFLSPTQVIRHWDAIHENDKDFICLSVYPGRWKEYRLDNLKLLVDKLDNTDEAVPCIGLENVIVLTGWEYQQPRGLPMPSNEVMKGELRYIIASLRDMGIKNIGVWDAPEGHHARTADKILVTAQLVVDDYTESEPPTSVRIDV